MAVKNKYEPEDYEMEFAQFAEQQEAEQPGQQAQPLYKSLAADVGKGVVEGFSRFGRMFGPLMDERPESEIQGALTQALDELVPSEDTFAGSSARRGLHIAIPAMGTPAGPSLGLLGRSLAGGTAGQAVEELGGPEWLQTVAEIVPLLAPGLGKKIQPTAKQKESVEFLRKMGATEEEIAPLIQGKKESILGIAAEKGGSGTERAQASQKALGRVYNTLKSSPEADVVLSDSAASQLVRDLQDKLHDMPSSVREVIAPDFREFVSGTKSGKDLINFFQDVNANMSSKTKQLDALKSPIKDALMKVNPNLAQEFDMTNKLYSRYSSIAETLKPSLADKFYDLSKISRFAYGAFTGNFPLIAETVGESAARKLAREMLVNPRYQNLSKQIVQSLNKGKFGIANRLKDQYIKTVKKNNPEVAAELEKLNFEEFEKAITNQ